MLPAVTPVHHLLSSRTIFKEQQEHQSSPDRFTIPVVIRPAILSEFNNKEFCVYLPCLLISDTFLPRPYRIPWLHFWTDQHHCLIFLRVHLTTCLLTRRHSGTHPPTSQTLPHPSVRSHQLKVKQSLFESFCFHVSNFISYKMKQFLVVVFIQ